MKTYEHIPFLKLEMFILFCIITGIMIISRNEIMKIKHENLRTFFKLKIFFLCFVSPWTLTGLHLTTKSPIVCVFMNLATVDCLSARQFGKLFTFFLIALL